MSNLDIFDELEADAPIEFPDYELGQSRSTVYVVGKATRFDLPGEEDLGGIVKLNSGRLVRIRARRQENSKGKLDLITFVEIVVDEEIGVVDNEGNVTVLKPYTDPRFAAWQDRSRRPHRVYGQNWGSDPEAVMALVNHCRKHFGFRVTKNPPMNTRPNAGYKQTIPYLFEARPATPLLSSNGGQQDWSKYGAPVEAFEIRVNPDYEEGFKSFVHGVTENLRRIVEASRVENPEERALAMEDASRFSGSITGITETNGNTWAKNADITTLSVGGSEFRIWNPGQDSDLTMDDLSGANVPTPQADMGSLSLDDLELPKPQAQPQATVGEDEPF